MSPGGGDQAQKLAGERQGGWGCWLAVSGGLKAQAGGCPRLPGPGPGGLRKQKDGLGSLGAKGWTVWIKSRRLVPRLCFGELPSFLAVASPQKLPGKAGPWSQHAAPHPRHLPRPAPSRSPGLLLTEEKGQGSGMFQPSATLSWGPWRLLPPRFPLQPEVGWFVRVQVESPGPAANALCSQQRGFGGASWNRGAEGPGTCRRNDTFWPKRLRCRRVGSAGRPHPPKPRRPPSALPTRVRRWAFLLPGGPEPPARAALAHPQRPSGDRCLPRFWACLPDSL